MPFPEIADSKKIQTMINVVARQALELQRIDAVLDAVRDAWTAVDPDPTGTPLDGQLAQVVAWAEEVKAAANNAAVAGLIAAARPGHSEEY